MAAVLPRDVVSRIKEETDIVSLVRGYLTLKPAGSGFKGLCPFHREKTPSFNINPHLQIYKCFGCSEGGDAISFLMKIENISFVEALETLARPLDIDLSRYLREEDESEGERLAFHRANEAAAGTWQEAFWSEQGRAARNYLQERGFGEEILKRYEVGYASGRSDLLLKALEGEGVGLELALRSQLVRTRDDRAPFAYFRNRIIFPVKNIAQRIAGFGGRILGQGEPKYINSPDSAYFSKGKLLYGFAASRISIARLKTAILVEGYLDQLALVQAGFGNVVATCGTAFTVDQAKILRRGCRTILLMFDGDRAGLQAAVKAGHVALAVGLEPKVARLLPGEDPASLLFKKDREVMEKTLAGAQGYLPLLRTLVQERGDTRELRERALRQGLKSIATVPDPIRQEYLLQEASDLFGIGVNILREHLEQEERINRSRRGQRERSAPAQASVDEQRPDTRGGIRSFATIDHPAIEATLLAHVLRDGTGEAARVLVDEGGEHRFVSPEAEQLRQELHQWCDTQSSQEKISPAAFVQERWHTHDSGFRHYVSELLAKEVVPEKTDFVRVVRDCLQRLVEDRNRRPS